MPDAGHAELLQVLRDRPGALDRQFVSVHDRLVAVDRRPDGLERDLREFRAGAPGHLGGIHLSLERLEQDYQAVLHGVCRTEVTRSDERRRREIIEQSGADLKAQLAALQARLTDLERRLASSGPTAGAC